MVNEPPLNLQSRDDVLERLSRSHMEHALEPSAAEGGAASAAFQAGYCALMASLSPDEVGAFDDHPCAEAAVLGAQRLQLEPGDLHIAREGATLYYSPTVQTDLVVQRQVAWARRARAAAGWPV